MRLMNPSLHGYCTGVHSSTTSVSQKCLNVHFLFQTGSNLPIRRFSARLRGIESTAAVIGIRTRSAPDRIAIERLAIGPRYERLS